MYKHKTKISLYIVNWRIKSMLSIFSQWGYSKCFTFIFYSLSATKLYNVFLWQLMVFASMESMETKLVKEKKKKSTQRKILHHNMYINVYHSSGEIWTCIKTVSVTQILSSMATLILLLFFDSEERVTEVAGNPTPILRMPVTFPIYYF